MTIIPRTEHHAEVTEPEVYTTTAAGRLLDVTIELPDHMVELSPEEARRLVAHLTLALEKHRST